MQATSPGTLGLSSLLVPVESRPPGWIEKGHQVLIVDVTPILVNIVQGVIENDPHKRSHPQADNIRMTVVMCPKGIRRQEDAPPQNTTLFHVHDIRLLHPEEARVLCDHQKCEEWFGGAYTETDCHRIADALGTYFG